MRVFRQTPFPLSISYDWLTPTTEYICLFRTNRNHDIVAIESTSDSDGKLDIELTSYFNRYDDDYLLEIYEKDGEVDGVPVYGDIVKIDTVSVYRPYFNIEDFADTEEELAEMENIESVVRSVIDSVTGGFYYDIESFETVGLGADFLPVPYRINRILRVYENNVLVFDTIDDTFENLKEYYVTPDKTAIGLVYPEAIDRKQSKSTDLPLRPSDSFSLYETNDSSNFFNSPYTNPVFPKDYDYVVYMESGWPIVPDDINKAAKMLANDIKCGAPYANQYIVDYKSDQFNIKFDPQAFSKTGNKLVDQILSGYAKTIYRLGVL